MMANSVVPMPNPPIPRATTATSRALPSSRVLVGEEV